MVYRFYKCKPAILNLLPIPVLDGGHMVFATIEKIRGPLPIAFLERSQIIFVVLLFHSCCMSPYLIFSVSFILEDIGKSWRHPTATRVFNLFAENPELLLSVDGVGGKPGKDPINDHNRHHGHKRNGQTDNRASRNGCEIVRITAPNVRAAEALGERKKSSFTRY